MHSPAIRPRNRRHPARRARSLLDNCTFGVEEPGRFQSIELSPNGTQAAVTILDQDQTRTALDIWIADVERGSRMRLTSDQSVRSLLIWSPTGDRLVFASNPDAQPGLYVKPSSGRGSEQLLIPSTNPLTPTDWSRDSLIYRQEAAKPDSTYGSCHCLASRNRNYFFRRSSGRAVVGFPPTAIGWSISRMSPDDLKCTSPHFRSLAGSGRSPAPVAPLLDGGVTEARSSMWLPTEC